MKGSIPSVVEEIVIALLPVASGIVTVRVASPPAAMDVAERVAPKSPVLSTDRPSTAAVPGLLSVNVCVVPSVVKPKLKA